MKNNSALVAMITFVILFAVPSFVFAGDEPPTNDNMSAATPIVLSGETGSVTTWNYNATKQPGEPNHAENVGGTSVWFKFTPLVTKPMRINITQNTFDTLLAVYTGNAVNELQLVGYNNDVSIGQEYGGASTVDLMMTAGVTYYLAVDGVSNEGVTSAGTFKIALLQFDTPFADNFQAAHYLGYSYKGSIAGTNFNATAEPNEPLAHTSGGGKSVWYKWTANDSIAIAFELTENFESQIGIYTSAVETPTFAQLTQVTSNADWMSYDPGRYTTTFFAETNKTYYIKIDCSFSCSNAAVGNFQLKYYLHRMPHAASFDRFGHRASIGVFRPSEGAWYVRQHLDQENGLQGYWGKMGDTPIAADFDGIGYARMTAIRNENGQKTWYIRSGSTMRAIQWGLSTDKPVTGDFDRDGRADPTVIRNSPNGYLWYVRQSRDESLRVFNFGTTGDKPILGDFDGDGFTDVCVLRNTVNGLVWYQIKSGFGTSLLYTQTAAFQFGVAGDVPAVADFDGDRKTDVAIFRPSTGIWYILRSESGQVQVTQFGAMGDKPQPADYDGDGKADLALFRQSAGDWYLWLSGTNAQRTIHWGNSSDIAISSFNTLSQ